MFVIRLADGEEVQSGECDELTISQETGVLTVCRVDGSRRPPPITHRLLGGL